MSKRSGCLCPGHWTQKKEHYVVTRRGKATVEGKEVASRYSEIKCMRCYQKWRSSARYVEDLADHTERTYSPLTDEDILGLVRAGRIRVDFTTGGVFKQRKAGPHWINKFVKLKPRPNRDAPGRWHSDRNRADPYLFVTICCNNCRKEIGLSRLVWMAYHDQLIPEDHDVDHVDRDKSNNAAGNLRLLHYVKNRGCNGDDEF